MVNSPDRADEVRRLFNTRAAAWSAFYAPGGGFTGRLALFDALLTTQVPVGGRMLDLGCGSGEIARAGAAAGLRVTGCDISELMLRSAVSRDPGSDVEWVQLETQWRRLPFPTASFDAVVAASVLEYVDEPSVVLAECARILRPGGLLACTVPDPRHPVRWLESVVSPCARLPGVLARRPPLAPAGEPPDLPSDLAAAACGQMVARRRAAGGSGPRSASGEHRRIFTASAFDIQAAPSG